MQLCYFCVFQVPLRLKLLIFIWFLATKSTYREICLQFDVSEATCCRIVHTFADLFTKYLAPRYIKWPDATEREKIATEFENRTGFPGVTGCIDGCHIPVKRPAHSNDEYYNRKDFHSIILQGGAQEFLLY